MNLKTTLTSPSYQNASYVINGTADIYEGMYRMLVGKGAYAQMIPQGSAVYIKEVLNEIDSGQKYLKLEFWDAHGARIEVPFPRKNLTEQGVLELLGLGVQVTKKNATALITSILNQEADAPYKLFHKTLGFWEYNDSTVFLGGEGIGVESKYTGNLKINQHGDFTAWMDMIKTEVQGNVPMELMLAVGGSGVLVDYLKEDTSVHNIIVHLIGESSSGKSTAGLFMVSCGAKPSIQGDSLVMNFSDTFNAIIAGMKPSFPILLDEGSLCRYNPTGFLYSISMGMEKKRLSKNMETLPPVSFNTAIAITSEKSLLNISDENTGLLMRNIEIQGIEWTRSAKSADIIKSTIQHNYGFLTPMVAQWVIDEENKGHRSHLIKWYDFWCEKLIERAKENNYYNSFTERAVKQSAIILMTAEILEEILEIQLDVEGISNLLEEHSLVNDPDNVDISKRAMVYLLQYLSRYYAHFITPDTLPSYPPQDCKGKIEASKDKVLEDGTLCNKCLYVSESVFVQILQSGNFPEKKVILKKWKQMGILKCEADRYLSDITIKEGIPAKGYIIRIPSNEKVPFEINEGYDKDREKVNSTKSKSTETECQKHIELVDNSKQMELNLPSSNLDIAKRNSKEGGLE